MSYLNNMSQQSSWCDHLAVQAVSDALHVTIHITESHAQFEYYESFSFLNNYFGIYLPSFPTHFPLLHEHQLIRNKA